MHIWKMSKSKLTRLLAILVLVNVLRVTFIILFSNSHLSRQGTTSQHIFELLLWARSNYPEPMIIPWPVCSKYIPRDFMLSVKMPVVGRLGNFMFVYASTLGISYTQNYTPAVETTNNPLPFVFNITSKMIAPRNWIGWDKFVEARPHAFDKRVRAIEADKDQYLKGYYQSWKYFADPNIQELLRREFQFKDNIFNQALAFINNVTKQYEREYGTRYGVQNVKYTLKRSSNSSHWSKTPMPCGNESAQARSRTSDNRPANELRLIGVHVRRGDLPESYNRQKGYSMAPLSYIHKAMRYFEVKYNSSNLLFIICSDSLDWVKLNVKSQVSPIVISQQQRGEVDLAVLTLCDDVIMTVGTFGWWAGWLAGGTTVYWNGFPEPRSHMATNFNPKDYYPRHWIGMAS